MKSDLERIWRSQGIEVNFALCLYESVDQIRSYIEHQNHTAVFAVLPDDRAESAEDCYNLIKRKIEVPSQCMQHQHLLPARLTNLSHAELQHVDPKKARRVSQTYEICLANLLVKHHWFPFAPRDRFNYNVQLGLDVGGVHNTSVMACFGYGFSTPETGIFLRPDEIPVSSAKVEPIPQTALFKGLLSIFEQARQELAEVPMPVDFSKTLFYRDGQLLGDGDDWNELEALKDLHEELRRRNWIPEGSVWTAVEILKGGHGWRIFNDNGQIENPIVGQCCFPFEEPNIGLVATTGAPYLTQGTAQPILIRIHDVAGKADRLEVVRDLVWQADMCFTKVDMGMSLPWVLNVADAGALQLARSYLIAGITT